MQQPIRALSILTASAAFLPACYIVAPPPPAAPPAAPVVPASSPTTLTAFAIAVRADQVDVRVATHTGNPAQHPTARAVVEDGYTLVGGGCSDQYTEPGNMLWASYPDPAGNAWVCAGKDHHLPSPARISAFAIGVRRKHAR